MFLIAKGSLFFSFGAATKKALSPKVELCASYMMSKPLFFQSYLGTVLDRYYFTDVGSS